MEVAGALRRVTGSRGAGAGAGPGRGSEVTHRAPARPVAAVWCWGAGPGGSAAPPGAAHFRFPFLANTGGGGRAGGSREDKEEKEGPWHCRLPRPQAGQGRAGVASAPRGGLGRARPRGGDCGGRVSSAQGLCKPQPASKEGGPGGFLGACEARHGGEADKPGRPSVYG